MCLVTSHLKIPLTWFCSSSKNTHLTWFSLFSPIWKFCRHFCCNIDCPKSLFCEGLSTKKKLQLTKTLNVFWKDWNFYISPNNGLQTRALAICNATKDCLLNRTLATFKRYDPHSRYICPIYEIYIYAIYQIYIFPMYMYMYNTWHIVVFPEKNGNIQEIRPT